MPKCNGRLVSETGIVAEPVVAWLDFVMVPGRPMDWFGRMAIPKSHQLEVDGVYSFELTDGRVGSIQVTKINPASDQQPDATAKFSGIGMLQKPRAAEVPPQ